MTISQLLESSAEELEAMTDAQLNAWFTPMFTVTRPDPKAAKKSSSSSSKMDPKTRQAILIGKQYGIDIEGLLSGL